MHPREILESNTHMQQLVYKPRDRKSSQITDVMITQCFTQFKIIPYIDCLHLWLGFVINSGLHPADLSTGKEPPQIPQSKFD